MCLLKELFLILRRDFVLVPFLAAHDNSWADHGQFVSEFEESDLRITALTVRASLKKRD